MFKATLKNVYGEIIKQDDRYTVTDNTLLNNLTISSTRLHPGQSTNGHSHKGQEEIYIFLNGIGTMEINGIKCEVEEEDIIMIQDGEFHRVHNTGIDDLYFYLYI